MTEPRDRVIRAVTEDGSFRVITLRTQEVAQEAIRRQGLSGAEARLFGELLTATILVRETMAPGHRVQAILGADDTSSLVTDARPGGRTRGLVSRPEGAGPVALGAEGALLKMIRTLPGGRIHQSVVEADAGGISEAVMGYLQASEQVLATIRVACVVEDDRVVTSGGYIVQLLPECGRDQLTIMTERLADYAYLDDVLMRSDADPEVLLGELLWGFPFERLAEEDLVFACECSEERVLAALTTLPHDEVAAMVAADEMIELSCEYCRTQYHIAPTRLMTLLTSH